MQSVWKLMAYISPIKSWDFCVLSVLSCSFVWHLTCCLNFSLHKGAVLLNTNTETHKLISVSYKEIECLEWYKIVPLNNIFCLSFHCTLKWKLSWSIIIYNLFSHKLTFLVWYENNTWITNSPIWPINAILSKITDYLSVSQADTSTFLSEDLQSHLQLWY